MTLPVLRPRRPGPSPEPAPPGTVGRWPDAAGDVLTAPLRSPSPTTVSGRRLAAAGACLAAGVAIPVTIAWAAPAIGDAAAVGALAALGLAPVFGAFWGTALHVYRATPAYQERDLLRRENEILRSELAARPRFVGTVPAEQATAHYHGRKS